MRLVTVLPEHPQLGLANARQKFSIRHTEAVTQRVHEARRVLDLSINYYEQFKRFRDELATQRCTECQLHAVLDAIRTARRLAAPAALQDQRFVRALDDASREDPRPASRRRCLRELARRV